MNNRRASISRHTRETQIELQLDLDGSGQSDISTGVGFFDHMLDAWSRHGLFDLTLRVAGDLHVEEHHTVEDVAIALGRAIHEALGDRRGIIRTAHSFVPMDEALGFVAIDLSGRGYAVIDADFAGRRIGAMDADMIRHFLESIAIEGRFNLHARLLAGTNEHHKAEALFKAFARALESATRINERAPGEIPSTKGTVSA
jgi:imidazoleglycerol-phosphate dehydratase